MNIFETILRIEKANMIFEKSFFPCKMNLKIIEKKNIFIFKNAAQFEVREQDQNIFLCVFVVNFLCVHSTARRPGLSFPFSGIILS